MGKNIDMTGERYGRLTVVGLVPELRKNSHKVWLCKCDCGNYTQVIRPHLVDGRTQSCGCLHAERTSQTSKTHGMSDTRLFRIWWHMIARCEKPYTKSYKDYGGRGIKVCEEWHDSTKFFEWALANGYQEHLTIERINVNGNYEPNNCAWITKDAQARNTRRTVRITFNGETKALSEWARIMKIPYQTIESRYLRGLKPEEILFKGHFKSGSTRKEVVNG